MGFTKNMKKAPTIYLSCLIALHLLLGWGLSTLNTEMTGLYSRALTGQPLPRLTTWMMRIHIWPFAVVAVAGAGLIIYAIRRDRSRRLEHLAFGLLLLSSGLMFVSAAAYMLPLCPLVD